ncbi:MAG: DHA2 family efflux MFS transporter permease subunit [Acetobacteraceae bacterium]
MPAERPEDRRAAPGAQPDATPATDQPAQPAPVVAAPEPTSLMSLAPRQWLILLMVQLSTLLFGMTITLANVVLPQIRGALSATQDEISWVITFNLVATAIATPMTGWLSNRLGWRNMMLFSLAGFTVSSFLCGLATSLESLILFRIGQGLFGATLMPMGQAILLATFPRALHATVMVIWGVGAVFGPVFGPIFGSMVAEAYDWRSAFFMIVPPGLAAMVCVWFALRHHTERRKTPFDWTGFLALSIAIAAAQLIMDRGQRLDWFESTEIVLCAVLGVVAFWIFCVHCLTTADPFLNPRLLLDRNFTIGTLVAFFMGMLSFVSLVLFPGLLHDLRGYPDSTIGLLLAARGCGNWVAFLVIVPFSRRAPRLAVATGLAAQTIATWQMSQFDINLTGFDVFWTNMLQGFGFGLAYTPMTVLAFTTLPREQITEGTAVFTLVRNFGSSIFISITVVLLVRSTAANYARLTEYIAPSSRILTYPGLPDAWSVESLTGLMRLSREIQRQAAMIGYTNAFTLIAVVAAAAIPLVCLLRGAPRTT